MSANVCQCLPYLAMLCLPLWECALTCRGSDLPGQGGHDWIRGATYCDVQMTMWYCMWRQRCSWNLWQQRFDSWLVRTQTGQQQDRINDHRRRSERNYSDLFGTGSARQEGLFKNAAYEAVKMSRLSRAYKLGTSSPRFSWRLKSSIRLASITCSMKTSHFFHHFCIIFHSPDWKNVEAPLAGWSWT